MKTIIIGLLALLLSSCAISQKSATNKTISFSVPKQAKRKLNAKDIRPTLSKSNGYVKYANLNKGILYEVENVKFYVETADSENKKNYLQVMRESMLDDNRRGGIKWKLDEIKELNNLIYLKGVCKYPNDTFNYVTILAVNKSYTRQLVAYVEYDEKDKPIGDKVVQDFLKSVKFK